MANPQQVIQRAFSGGELAPALHARADLIKYATGLRRCRNFIVQRHGGVTNRGGTRFVGLTKTTSINVGLFRYVSENTGESMLWEMGTSYLRPYLNGARLQVVLGSILAYGAGVNYVIGDLVQVAGVVYYSLAIQIGVAPPGATWVTFTGTNYELPNPFGADLPHVSQSGRTLTLTHHAHAPYELINGGSTTAWVLRVVATQATLAAPIGLVTTAGNAGTLNVGYVVTAGALLTYEESLPSAQVIKAEAYPTPATAPDTLSWTAVAGAAEYYVYCDPAGNGIYGFLGTAAGTTFKNTGRVPDFTQTPPLANTKFTTSGDFPNRSGSFQQRRIFGYTDNAPDGIVASKTGLISNFGISQPLQNDDAVTFRMAGNNHNAVRHLLGLKDLIVLTGGGAWVVNGGGVGAPITPSAIVGLQNTYVGIGDVVPVVIGNSIVYVEKLGSTLFDLQFDLQVQGLAGKDLCIFSDHLFKGFSVNELDFQQNPDSVVWCCRSDGALLGMTYIREQEVWGWHRHDSGAACRFEHVCVVPEVDGDTVYLITRRTINGAFQRQIERLVKRQIVTFNTDAFFVDCGLSYSGAPTNNVTGLTHLNGQVVAVVGDGAVIFNGDPAAANAATFTVAAGTFAAPFPASYSNIHVGLQITAEVETLDLDVQGSSVRGKKKRVEMLMVLLEDSSRTFTVGPSSAALVPFFLKPWEAAANLFTGDVEMSLTSSFDDNGRIFIRHTDPLPLTILGILPDVELGG